MDDSSTRTAEDTAARSTMDPAAADDGAVALKAKRKRWLVMVAGAFAVAGIAYGMYWGIELRHIQSTDDAYVGGNVVQITPQISGTVVAIDADDTNFVKAGQTLVQLDQVDARIALDQAEAQLARTVRDVRSLFATNAQLQATVDMRQSDVTKVHEDLTRRERLASSGAISAEEAQHAREAYRSAQAALVAARQALAANRAHIDRTTVESHPDVKAAAARVHEAYLTYARTALPAPVAGFVAKRAVQLGQRVSPGTPLMAVVPLDQVWIDANFKEPQLAGMRVGQPAQVTTDLYGSDVVFHGRIAGFGAGTGAAFALLPAQNATGNWIKIVQRVPVRIALDPQELVAHPLQIGLSMQVAVDTQGSSGDRLPHVAHDTGSYKTDVFGSIDAHASDRVHAIIAANEAAGPQRALGASTGDDAAKPHRLAHSDHASTAAQRPVAFR